MGSGTRGILAVVGLVVGFLTIVFVSQFFRYLTPALTGDSLSLGMAGTYGVLTFAGTAVAILSFKPSRGMARYMSGVGAAVTGLYVLAGAYLLSIDLSAGMLVLVITTGNIIATAVLYAIASGGDPAPDSETQPKLTS